MDGCEVNINRFKILPQSFDEEFDLLSARHKRRLSKTGQIAQIVAEKIYGNSHDNSIVPERIGVIFATCFGAIDDEIHHISRYQTSGSISPLFLPKIMPNMISSSISIDFNLKSFNYSIYSGQLAFLEAIIEGFDVISDNRSEAVLIIGSESCKSKYSESIAEHYHQKECLHYEGGGGILLTNHNEESKNKYKIRKYKSFFSEEDFETKMKKLFDEEINITGCTLGSGFIVDNNLHMQEDIYVGCIQSMMNLKELFNEMDKRDASKGIMFSMLSSGLNISIEFFK